MKKLQYTILALLGLTPSVFAQQPQILNDGIIIDRQEIKQKNDSLSISMLLNISELTLPSVRSLTLTPILTDGKTEKALLPILLNGSNRHKVYRRHVVLGHELPETYYIVSKVGRKNKRPINYNKNIVFEPWMASAKLYLIEDYCGCGGYSELQNRELLHATPALMPVKANELMITDIVKPYESQFMYCYSEPTREMQKKRTELKDVYLNFPVNQIVIYPDYMNNRTELERTQDMIEKINSDKNLTIQKITYRGYASPEGSVASNCRLSEGRAAALKNYLTPRLHNNRLPMFSESGCEDWEGTIDLLTKSNITGRDLLLEAIRKCDRSDAAEMRLRTLDGGTPYAAMLSEIYPKVRRVVCSVDFTVREFTVEEGRRLINSHPELLSQYEMYQIACSYPANSPEFLNALRIAEQQFPQDETALLNGAMVALREGKDEKAAGTLQNIKNHNVVYLNAKGILLMRQDQKAEAKACFEKAIEKNSEAARHNLSELEKTMK